MKSYVLFTGQNCSPCETVKTMISQSPLGEGVSLEIVDAATDERVVDFVVRSVPTLVNLDTKVLTTGVFNIVRELNHAAP